MRHVTTAQTAIPSRFNELERLGHGRTGTVFLVQERSSGRLFALKLLAPTYGPDALATLRQEFATLRHLHYPLLGRVHELSTSADGASYLLREYVPGTPLAAGPPPAGTNPQRFLRPILDVLAALLFLHRNRCRHLDLHAGNVIERSDGRGVLIDIGVFVPPAQSAAAGETDRSARSAEASDLYAAGLLLLFRLTGNAEPSTASLTVPGWDDRTVLHLERLVESLLSAPPDRAAARTEECYASLARVLGLDGPLLLAPGESHCLVGQQKVVDAFEALLEQVGRGAAGSLWLRGGPGSGKTRCLAELRERAQLRGVRTVELRFFPEVPSSLRAIVARLAPRGAVDRRSRLSILEPEAAAGWLLDRIAALPESERVPTVVTIDDFHHADRCARDFFEQCLGGLTRGGRTLGVGLVLASSAAPAAHVPIVSLRPLTRGDSHRLLSQLVFPLALSQDRRNEIVAGSGGNPKALYDAARCLRRTSANGAPAAEATEAAHDALKGLARVDPESRRVLRCLAVFARPARAAELCVATGLPRAAVERRLEGLAGFVTASRHGRRQASSYALAGDSLRDAVAAALSPREERALHAACAAAIEKAGDKADPAVTVTSLVRHHARAGNPGRAEAFLQEAIDALIAAGNPGEACRLIALVFPHVRALDRRRALAAALSDLARTSGQDDLAREILEKVLPCVGPHARIELLRRLGVHHHRLGDERQALSFLRRAVREAEPARDRAELIECEAELSEIFISNGEFEEAAGACRRGLAHLAEARKTEPRAARESETTLRAIAGRMHLRKFELGDAVRQFLSALRLARVLGDRQSEASILNNLAVAYHQLDDLARARTTFRATERLSQKLGRRETTGSIACNLALIAAKTGDAEQARQDLERAGRVLAEVPGDRARFALAQTETIVTLTLGFPEEAAARADDAIALGNTTGELPHVRFLELYRAEACMEQARLEEADKALRRLVRDRRLVPALRRMVATRAAYLAALLGRSRSARRLLAAARDTPAPPIAYLEAWNGYFAGRALELCGEDGRTQLLEAHDRFRRSSMPLGAARCGAALLTAAVDRGEEGAVRTVLYQLEPLAPTMPGLLAAEIPLTCAEACILLGEAERARTHLKAAGRAIVGKVFPELDIRIEETGASLSILDGDAATARQHLHRAATFRMHIASQLGKKDKDRYLAHPRWRRLRALENDLFRAAPAPPQRESPETERDATYGIIARSPAMQALLAKIRVVGPRDVSVLIRGPTGSGKELIARAVHDASARRDRSFTIIDVSSLQPQLFEAELFGFVQGAFTGAEKARAGLLASADGGTVCFDEIAAVDLEAQAKLLRAIDSREIRPLGALATQALDLRFLFTTSRDLRGMVAQHRFREDLYWRIAQTELVVPALEDRREDIPELALTLMRKHWRMGCAVPALAPEVVALLLRQPWPGNVRQLETILIRAMLAATESRAITADLLRHLLSSSPSPGRFSEDLLRDENLDALRRELELAWLKRRFLDCGGNMRSLARKLGLARQSLYEWFQRLGADPEAWRDELARR